MKRFWPQVLVVVIILTTLPGPAAADYDPWYEDVHRSLWAYRDIRLMWEEECADGWQFTRWRWSPWGEWEQTIARFYPDDPMTRAQFAFLMAKTFRLSPVQTGPAFTDVPCGFTLYGDKPAYGHIQAAATQGWLQGTGDGRFRPHDQIERQHAVALLIRALGLADFAASLADTAAQYLRRYPDGYQVDPSVAPEVALAIRLQILLGYDDGRLYPRRSLTRCQGVAFLVRSALVDVQATPPRLSPDADGVEDNTWFAFRTLRNRSTSRWSLSIGNLEGQWYRWFHPRGQPGEPPPLLSWDGTADNGTPLADGVYYYRAWIEDSQGQRFFSALKPLQLERRRLWGSLVPTQVYPGQAIEIRAGTTGGATSVSALLSGSPIPLQPAQPPAPTGSNTWWLTQAVPDGEEGVHSMRLLARYPGTTRTVELMYYLRDPLTLTGTLEPNPTRAGTRVRVVAFTSANVSSVEALLPWDEHLTLHRDPGGNWQGWFLVPPDTADGSYPLVLEARTGQRSRQQPLTLIVQGSTLEDVAVILSD
ncbi:MAG TPA: hypothetical protein GX513_09275 [Firmicutes bacterium]|nr:hypothetical protein [Bacillota bacterium]